VIIFCITIKKVSKTNRKGWCKMGTISMIALEMPNKEIRSIYCHWDGYLSGNGRTLLEHYQDITKIEALLNEGNISSLGKEIGEKHNFNGDRPEGFTTFYGRDRGDKDMESVVVKNERAFWNDMEGSGYFYLFRDGKWMYSKGIRGEFKEVTKKICDEEDK
jgi:hypothetical protein